MTQTFGANDFQKIAPAGAKPLPKSGSGSFSQSDLVSIAPKKTATVTPVKPPVVDHTNTYDEKGNIIQVNGKDTLKTKVANTVSIVKTGLNNAFAGINQGIQNTVEKLTGRPDESKLGTNVAINTLKYFPSSLIETILPGVKAIRDNPEEASKITAMDLVKELPGATGEVAKSIVHSIASYPLTFYGASSQYVNPLFGLGKAPGADENGAVRFSIPGLGDFTNIQARIMDDPKNAKKKTTFGTVIDTAKYTGEEFLNGLFTASMASSIFNPRIAPVTKTGTATVPEGASANMGPRSFRLYEPQTMRTPIADDAFQKITTENNIPVKTSYNPKYPTYFEFTGASSNSVTGRFVQVRPSYFDSFISKFMGDVSKVPTNQLIPVAEVTKDMSNVKGFNAKNPIDTPAEIAQGHLDKVKAIMADPELSAEALKNTPQMLGGVKTDIVDGLTASKNTALASQIKNIPITEGTTLNTFSKEVMAIVNKAPVTTPIIPPVTPVLPKTTPPDAQNAPVANANISPNKASREPVKTVSERNIADQIINELPEEKRAGALKVWEDKYAPTVQNHIDNINRAYKELETATGPAKKDIQHYLNEEEKALDTVKIEAIKIIDTDTKNTVYRGTGKTKVGMIGSDLGSGVYYADDLNVAKEYGDKIETLDLSTKKIKEISDEDYNKLVQTEYLKIRDTHPDWNGSRESAIKIRTEAKDTVNKQFIAEGYDGIGVVVAGKKIYNIFPENLKNIKTQKEIVKQAITEEPKTIKQIADETKILEPNVRRILGVGAKEGTFTRVDKGVYVLSKDGVDRAFIEANDAEVALARMAEEGKKFHSIILDPAYYSRALVGGNRGIKKWEFIMPDAFANVMKSVSKLVETPETQVYLMLSGARTAQPDMEKYVIGATDAGFKVVGEGAYTKTFKDGKPVTNVRGETASAERLILMTKSGEVVKGEIPVNLNFRFIRPSIATSYQTEKPAELMRALIEQSTLNGQTVLDPFAGSGVTGAEAVRTGRIPTLVEKSAEVVDTITKPRVEKALSETTTDKPFTKNEIDAFNRNSHYDTDWNKEYASSLENIQAKFGVMEIPDVLKNDWNLFKTAYLGEFRRYLTIRADNPSPFVTGRANFNYARKEKLSSREDKAIESMNRLEEAFGKKVKAYKNEQNKLGGTKEEKRQAIRDAMDKLVTKGSRVGDILFGEGEVIKVNSKTYTVKYDRGYTQVVDKSRVTPLDNVNPYEADMKFKKPMFSKMEGPKISIEEAKKIIFKEIPEDKVRLIFNEDLLTDTGALGMYRPSVRGILKPVIELYVEGNMTTATTAYHEAGHYIFDNFLDEAGKEEVLTKAKKELSLLGKIDYTLNGYRGTDVIAEEYVMEEYAKYKSKKAGYKTTFQKFFEKLDAIFKNIWDTIKKAQAKWKAFVKSAGGSQKGAINLFADINEGLSKEEIERKLMREAFDAEKATWDSNSAMGEVVDNIVNGKMRIGTGGSYKVEARELFEGNYMRVFSKNPNLDKLDQVVETIRRAGEDISPDDLLEAINKGFAEKRARVAYEKEQKAIAKAKVQEVRKAVELRKRQLRDAYKKAYENIYKNQQPGESKTVTEELRLVEKLERAILASQAREGRLRLSQPEIDKLVQKEIEKNQQEENTTDSVPFLPSENSFETIIAKEPTPVNKKVSLIDYFATPEYVLNKVGLGNIADAVRTGYKNYTAELPEHIDLIKEWRTRVPAEMNKVIFRYLDTGVDDAFDPLSHEALRVAIEIREYLSDWAFRLGLPEDEKISHYITHLFDSELIQKEFDEDLATLIQDKVPGQVYDPFLEKRIGAKGYIEDTWRALNAYVKRAVRKANMDPALEELKNAVVDEHGKPKVEQSIYNYVKRYGDRVNLRPMEIDNLLDNLIKQIPFIGYKFGQRPTAVIFGTLRKWVSMGTIGGNMGSAVKNLTQGVNTYAELGEKYTLIGYTQLFTKFNNPDAIKEIHDSQILGRDIAQDVDSSLSLSQNITDRLQWGLFLVFQTVEKVNRISAYWGAKAKGLDEGMSEDKAREYAEGLVRKTQFQFGQVDTPVAMQGDIAKTLLQLGTYTIKQTEFLGKKIINVKKDWLGLLRYIGAFTFIVLVLGKIFNFKWSDANPFTRFTDWGLPPVFKPLGEINSAISDKPGYFGQKRDAKQKALDVANSFVPFLPGGIQFQKSYRGIKRLYFPSKNQIPVQPTIGKLIKAVLLGQSNLDYDKQLEAFAEYKKEFTDAKKIMDQEIKEQGTVTSFTKDEQIDILKKLPAINNISMMLTVLRKTDPKKNPQIFEKIKADIYKEIDKNNI